MGQNTPVEKMSMPAAKQIGVEKEQAIHQLREWLRHIYPPGKIDRAISAPYSDRVTCKLFTATNEYTIEIALKGTGLADAYLGAGAIARKNRAGEVWGRGNDLRDGKFSEQTWNAIMQDIVRYETQEIVSEAWK